MRLVVSRLTATELGVLQHLTDAWNSFVAMPEQHPADAEEFAAALHRLQAIIAMRVARRANPEIWRVADVAG
jgi:hypothetical protein